MKASWKIKPNNLSSEHQGQWPPSLSAILANRDLVEKKEIEKFLKPVYEEGLHDPFLLKDMSVGVERTLEAIKNKERITVFADYDADAVTSAAVMMRGIRQLGGQVDYYIPDRFSEGYGMNVEAVQEIAKRDTNLILTVDCGITAVEEVEESRKLGVDLVITDHHQAPDVLPEALACINPQRPDDQYPCKDLTGVGVAYKFIQALFLTARKQNLPAIRDVGEGWEKWLLDLVAIGTIADCQALLGENRCLTKHGLLVLQKTRWPGLRALISVAGIDKDDRDLDGFTIGFQIAPRLNAAGRIAKANIALDLLLTDNHLQAADLALQLEKLNLKRRSLTDNVVSEAKVQLEGQNKKNKILFAYAPDWPKGIVGLVAGKLTEEFYRPVLVGSQDEKFTTGSARSIPGFNIYQALKYAREHTDKFGGHEAAAGFTLKNEKVVDFYATLNGYAEINLADELLRKNLLIDAELTNSQEFSYDYAALLETLEPFGQSNPQPLFLLRNLKVEEVRPVGSEGKHVQLFLRSPYHSLPFKCIAFRHGYLAKALKPSDKIDLVAEMTADRWMGRENFQFRLVDWDKVT